ncbi:hypothetical protein [Paenibacillus sp. NPDC055715]
MTIRRIEKLEDSFFGILRGTVEVDCYSFLENSFFLDHHVFYTYFMNPIYERTKGNLNLLEYGIGVDKNKEIAITKSKNGGN